MASNTSDYLDIHDRVPEFVLVKEERHNEIGDSYEEVCVRGSTKSDVEHVRKKEIYNESNLLIHQLEEDLGHADRSKYKIECSGNDKEKEIYTGTTDFVDFLENQKRQIFRLLSSNMDTMVESSLFKYKEFDCFNESKQENFSTYKESEDSSFPSSLENVSKNSENKRDRDFYEMIAKAADAPGSIRSKELKCESNEVKDVSQCSNEFVSIRPEPPIRVKIKVKRNQRKRKNFLTSKCHILEYSQDNQRIETEVDVQRMPANSSVNTASILEIQTKTDSNVKLYESQLCEGYFLFPFNLKKQSITYNCAMCGYKTTKKSHLVMHMRNHTGDKPYECEICGYKSAHSYHLKYHMRTHSGEKPYECKTCGFKCALNFNLKKHMRRHTGEKPFKCEVCEYTCAERISLKSHIQIHFGVKPYQCTTCGFKCAHSCSLKRHMRRHTGEKPYRCEVCGFKCTQSCHLKQHIRIHSGEKLFQCEICGYECIQKSSLQRHIRTHL